jgi:phage terminase small subunit
MSETSSKMMVSLSTNQQRFVVEYTIDRNATRAYLRAFGPCAYGTARTEGSRLLTNPDIAAEIEAAKREHLRTCRIDARRVLRELAAVAFMDLGNFYVQDQFTGLPMPRNWQDIPPTARRALRAVKVKRRRLRGAGPDVIDEVEEIEFKFADKLAALDRLCKYLGLTKGGAALEELLVVLRRDSAGATPGPSALQAGE